MIIWKDADWIQTENQIMKLSQSQQTAFGLLSWSFKPVQSCLCNLRCMVILIWIWRWGLTRIPPFLLFWPLFIVLRPLYWRKWMCIAEKHLCGRVKMWTALHTSGMSTHGLTHRNRPMLPRFRVPHHRVKSCISTKLRQATSSEYISYNLIRSGSEPSSSGSFPAKSFL